ncbi:MAG: hypoxanthine phosphoribosyltransferase [Chloroflexi bacterium]|nr:hypoxanthine phosphoribosyltransferase [Chloroflexota bacterium]MCY4248290.1 hypoxanthine phosphoribosyltransferase [Chloroflexota bacterium]
MPAAYQKYLAEVLIDEAALQARITQLGEQINRDYAECADLLLLCILKGGVMFLTDLSRHIHVPHMIDFMAASSYGVGARKTAGSVRIDMDLTMDVRGKHVLVVEDIIDSGHTLAFVLKTLRSRQPASLRLCALLNKQSRREVALDVDYIGFEIENKFVFGYGLDLDERFRNLRFVAVANTAALTDA